MLTYIKNLIAELSFFRHRREAMRDLSKNPILDWWREHDFEPRLIKQAGKVPPVISAPIADEDYLIALEIGFNAINGLYDRNALKNGLVRLSFQMKLIKVLIIFVITLIFLNLPGVRESLDFNTGLFAFICLSEIIIMSIPFRWLLSNIRILDMWVLKTGPIGLVSLVLSVAVFIYGLTMADWLYNGLLNMAQYLKITLIILPFEIIIVVILMCYAIRTLKQITHERRMET